MSFSMFNDIVEWFLGKGDRRQYKRRAGAFHLWWQPNPNDPQTRRQGIGLEVSPNGIMFIVPEKITTPEYNLILRIREYTIPVRVKGIRTDQIQHQGKPWNRYSGEFLGISADHWDVIVRYVNDQPEPVDKTKENQALVEHADDAYRLLPMAVQQKVVTMLIEQQKLAPPEPGAMPLLKLFYSGIVKRPGQKPAHRFNVHSRVEKNGEWVAYDTRFLISEDGEITLL